MQQSMQQRRATRAKRSQVEQSRLRVLAQMAAFLDKASHDYSPDTNPSWDYFTSFARGQCSECSACAGFCRPPSHVNPHELLAFCASCGCRADKHEQLRH